jgi:hypothetical protein
MSKKYISEAEISNFSFQIKNNEINKIPRPPRLLIWCFFFWATIFLCIHTLLSSNRLFCGKCLIVSVSNNVHIKTSDLALWRDSNPRSSVALPFSWGLSTLFVQTDDIFPRNLTAATSEILHTNLVTFPYIFCLRPLT